LRVAYSLSLPVCLSVCLSVFENKNNIIKINSDRELLELPSATVLLGGMGLLCLLHGAFVNFRGPWFIGSQVVQCLIFAITYFGILFNGISEETGSTAGLIFLTVRDILFFLVLSGETGAAIGQVEWGNRKSFLTRLTLEKQAVRVHEIQKESEILLGKILPPQIAQRLIQNPTSSIAYSFPEVSIIFCDIPNFSGSFSPHQDPLPFSSSTSSITLAPEFAGNQDEGGVALLDRVVTQIDESCSLFGIEKIKTIGIVYMAMSGGLPSSREGHHCWRMLLFALYLQELIAKINEELNTNFVPQIGINGFFFFLPNNLA